jgi:hypothetical protein
VHDGGSLNMRSEIERQKCTPAVRLAMTVPVAATLSAGWTVEALALRVSVAAFELSCRANPIQIDTDEVTMTSTTTSEKKRHLERVNHFFVIGDHLRAC